MFKPFVMMRRWLGGEDASPAEDGCARTRVWREGGEWIVDVRGQTCPGYLLEIDRAVARIGPGARIHLLISYPPCGDDVRVWCEQKGHVLHGLELAEAGHFDIGITSGQAMWRETGRVRQ